MADAAAASAVSGPPAARAVSYLHEISPEMRGCAIFGPGGQLLAATGDETGSANRWAEPGEDFLAAADAAGGKPVAHAHVATADGEAFCVRHAELAAVAVTERFVLASLMIFDLRTVLRNLAEGKTLESERRAGPNGTPAEGGEEP